MSNAPLPELEIGELLLWRGHEKVARVAYDPHRPIAVAHTHERTASASQMLEALALQLLDLYADTRVGVELALFEPLPSPQFGLLKRLFARTGTTYGKQLVGNSAYHAHIEYLTELAHKRFALLANLDVANLTEYNTHPRVKRKEPWKLLLVSAVLPQSGRDGDLAALQMLCREGGKVGILPLLLRGTAEENEKKEEYSRKPLKAFWKEVFPLCFGFDWRNNPPIPVNQLNIYWQSFKKFGIQVGVPVVHMQQWVDKLYAAQVAAVAEAEFPDFLRVPIGEDGNEVVYFSMGSASDVQHAMLGGKTRSGKTRLIHNVLLGACEAFTPEQLRLWIIDPKGRDFADYENLPHTEFLHSKLSLDERLMRALDIFHAKWQERTEILRNAKPKAHTIDEYNAIAKQGLPRCLFVVDEAHNVLENRRARELLGKIGREGAGVGLHMILLTQSYQELPFDSSVRGQISLRIGCKVEDEATSRNIFGHDNPAAAHLENSSGVRMAIVNAQGGKPSGNRLVHLYYLKTQQLNDRIDALAQRYPNRPPPLEPTAPSPKPAQTVWAHKAEELDDPTDLA